MKTSQNGLSLIQKFEGFKSKAYQDSVGIWTIGIGTTMGVKPGQVITEAQAQAFLARDVHTAEQGVTEAVKVPLNQNQFDALVCFTYNLGIGNLKSSTLLKKLNSGDYASVPSEMMKWNKAGGQVLNGLTTRRAAEGALFAKAV